MAKAFPKIHLNGGWCDWVLDVRIAAEADIQKSNPTEDLMDEQQQFLEALESVRALLPVSVVTTCESLNQHGEWELALGHCMYHLQGAELPQNSVLLIDACQARFQSNNSTAVPRKAFRRTTSVGL